MADPFFSSVSLLAFNDNAADGTTTFLDQSNNALTLTRHGTPAYTNAQAPTGMATSVSFNGTTQWLALPSNSVLDLSGVDFTIEAFVRLNGNDNTSYVLGPNVGVLNKQFRLNQNATGNISSFDGTTRISTASSAGWNNTWAYIAMVASGNTLTYYYNGVQLGSAFATGPFSFSFSALQIAIGLVSGASPNGGLNGWVGPLRITKGVARTISGVPSLPFPLGTVTPVADFSGTPTSGTASLSVAFTDLSTNTPTSWLWDFGDGNTSTSQNPTNVYASAGTYTVSLTATNSAGSNQATKTGYITVTSSSGAQPTLPPEGGGGQGSRGHIRLRSAEATRRRQLDQLSQILAAVMPYIENEQDEEIEIPL